MAAVGGALGICDPTSIVVLAVAPLLADNSIGINVAMPVESIDKTYWNSTAAGVDEGGCGLRIAAMRFPEKKKYKSDLHI